MINSISPLVTGILNGYHSRCAIKLSRSNCNRVSIGALMETEKIRRDNRSSIEVSALMLTRTEPARSGIQRLMTQLVWREGRKRASAAPENSPKTKRSSSRLLRASCASVIILKSPLCALATSCSATIPHPYTSSSFSRAPAKRELRY